MVIFRNEYDVSSRPSLQEMQAGIKKWQEWIASIASQGKFVATNR